MERGLPWASTLERDRKYISILEKSSDQLHARALEGFKVKNTVSGDLSNAFLHTSFYFHSVVSSLIIYVKGELLEWP